MKSKMYYLKRNRKTHTHTKIFIDGENFLLYEHIKAEENIPEKVNF